MALHFKQTFQHANRPEQYLNISAHKLSGEDETIIFELAAGQTNGEGANSTGQIRVTRDYDNVTLTTTANNQHKTFVVTQATNAEEAYELIVDALALAAGDPITRCLLKAGLTATGLQIIRCNRKILAGTPAFERIGLIKACLRLNLADMFSSATQRAICCLTHLFDF